MYDVINWQNKSKKKTSSKSKGLDGTTEKSKKKSSKKSSKSSSSAGLSLSLVDVPTNIVELATPEQYKRSDYEHTDSRPYTALAHDSALTLVRKLLDYH